MPAIDVVNRVFREFRRYTGDGLPNEPVGAPLPVGDPSSGPHNPKKSELREGLMAPMGEAEAAAQAVIDAAMPAIELALDFGERYIGPYANDAAATAAVGGAPGTGVAYFDTTLGKLKIWNLGAWRATDVAIADGSITEPKLAPGLLSYPGMLFGLTLSNNSADASNDIDIAAGSAASLSDATRMLLAAGMTKRLDAIWSAGSGNGGLDTGSKANSTTYHVFLIKNPTSGAVDVLFSTSAVSPAMPGGYTLRRRLGAFITNNSGNIRAFRQVGGWFHFMEPATDYAALAIGAAQNITLTVPAGIKVQVDLSCVVSAGSSGTAYFAVRDPDMGAATILDNVASYFAAGQPSVAAQINCWTNTSRQLSVFANQVGNLNTYLRGWYDLRDTYV